VSILVKTIVEKGAAGGPLRVVDDQVGFPTCTPDLAEAIERLVSRELPGIYAGMVKSQLSMTNGRRGEPEQVATVCIVFLPRLVIGIWSLVISSRFFTVPS
jgi:hypothetical protein